MIKPYLSDEKYKQILKERFYFIRYKDIDFAYIPTRLVLLLIKSGIKYDFDFIKSRFIIK